MNSSNLTVSTAIKLINQKEHYDTIIVDESHRLSRRGSKQHSAFNTIYKHTEFANCENHLEPLITLSNQVILMYDILQAIRPANISREKFKELTTGFEKCYLTTQFRIQAPEGKDYSSEDYVNGIKYLLYKDTDLLQYTNFDLKFDRSLFHDTDPDAYFGYFNEAPLENLIDWVEEDKNYHPEHINRVLSGLVEEWKQAEGKNPSITHFHESMISRRWNSTQENWINSTDDDAEDQIGSVFAVQGIDLNKVGVLIGNDLLVDKNGKLYGEPSNFKNVNGKHTKAELLLPDTQKEFTIFVLNIYYVLLTRGIDGIRIAFWHNDAFKEYFKKTFDF
ncbi:ATP/GTP binding protein [Lactococcus piscium]|uniref:ATP/GTP binding protein n=1 Tax=Pseudolactococcus piscium TaxID=1364 RepID=A0A2A5S2W5_9LACT|nr:DNA/RNA helicase domain-containing protein [Lactococcus piscium]PCS07814.1 ATP/GTP binding protein [Lactococcus piscium]